jgi:tetratricopeptide (TPR) repeat protein
VAQAWRQSLSIPILAVALLGQAATPDALGRARLAYNAGKFDEAISAAKEALEVPALANAAAVVLARADLERFRQSSNPEDLDNARAALKLVVPDRLTPRDHQEFLVALGLSLYLDGCTDGCFSAAAEFFDRALARADPDGDRERLFEWWAGALDRQAQFGPDEERVAVYRRILGRAEAELARDDRSVPANYWLAAAARGTGDLERAWGAAIAAWVRARDLGPRGDVLRGDLDRFVTLALLPERARQLAADADPRPALEQMLAQWDEIKKKYGYLTSSAASVAALSAQ